jgi:hypothetical protein
MVVLDGYAYITQPPVQRASLWNDAKGRLMLCFIVFLVAVAAHVAAVVLWHTVALATDAPVPLPAWLVFPGECAGAAPGARPLQRSPALSP